MKPVLSDPPPRPGATVVFGGAGFIGSHFLQRLACRGGGPLVSVDIRAPRYPVAGVRYLAGDVRDLTQLHYDGAIARIANFAAVHTTPGHDPWEYYDTNVLGALEVTRFARRHSVPQILFTSSISVYGPDERPKSERTQPSPPSDYGKSKLMAEQIHDSWLVENTVNRLVIVRPAVVFGLGEGGNFTRLSKLLERGIFVFPGRRDTIKSCIYVEDLIDWILKAEAIAERRILFNAAYTNRYTIEDIVTVFRRVAFPNVRTFSMPAPVLRAAAQCLRPISIAGLGIHPDRVEKLMTSTNILPTWAEAAGLMTRDRLEDALRDWRDKGNGAFL